MPTRPSASWARRGGRLGASALIVACAALSAACAYYVPRRGGNIQVEVQIPGAATGSVSYIGQITAPEAPAVSGAFSCFNTVEARCKGASVSQEVSDRLAVPLVTGGPHSTVSSFIQFAPLQPGTWSLIVHIDGSAAQELRLCEVPVAANTMTMIIIDARPNGPSARYQLGKERSGQAPMC